MSPHPGSPSRSPRARSGAATTSRTTPTSTSQRSTESQRRRLTHAGAQVQRLRDIAAGSEAMSDRNATERPGVDSFRAQALRRDSPIFARKVCVGGSVIDVATVSASSLARPF
jgi:hypothetical protein